MKAFAAQANIVEKSLANIDQFPQAQETPSLCGVFTLIYNGKVLADRYISATRLANILKNVIR
ncbi:MAG: hypothetical protein ABII93_03680 [Chrysiogenia bacterium]